MSRQLTLKNFGVVSPENITKKTQAKGRKVTQDEYEAKRPRKFVSSWKDKYPGLYEDNDKLYCFPCVKYSTISDPTSNLVLGSSSYRVGGLDSHWKSEPHRRAANHHHAQNVRDEGGRVEGPMDVIIQALNEQNAELLKKLFNTVYFILKYEEPFTSLPRLLGLQVKNGSDLHRLLSYKTDQACRR